MNLVELQNKIHQQNVEMGWWDNPRPFSTFVCLFHSELSEAMEGDRKNLMDDHLPRYPMFQVELADFVIRCLDWLGSVGYTEIDWKSVIDEYNEDEFEPWSSGCADNCEVLAELHCAISNAYTTDSDAEISRSFIAAGVICSYSYALEQGFDLEKVILEKVEYNKHRADHKRENRKKDGGKKY